MKRYLTFICLAFVAVLAGSTKAQSVSHPSKQLTPVITRDMGNPDSPGAVIVPVWNYQLQPVVTRMEYGASPAMVNLGLGVNNAGGEPDNYMEIITGSDEYSNFYPELNSNAYGIWRCFDALGNLEWASDTKSDEAKSSLGIADIDYDLHPEMAGGTTSGWCIEVMNRFGSWTSGVPDAAWTFPNEPQRNGSFMWHSSPAIGELITGANHEGLEVVGGNNPLMSIWALDGDNSDGVDDGITADLSGWGFPGPTGTEGTDWDVLWVFQTNGNIIASPAIGDVDGDGHNEVVCGSKDNSIYCINGQTGALKWSYATGGMITGSAGLADFDNDGKLEVVVGSQDGSVYFIKGDLDQNGIIDPTEFTKFITQGPVLSSPAIADFDGNGTPDVIIGSDDGKLYGLLYSPSANTVTEDWAYQTGNVIQSSPAVANSGRNQLTIYVGSADSNLYVLNGNGSLIEAYPANGQIITSPSVADVNGDGKLEIAFTAWREPDNFMVLRDVGSNVPAFSAPWPMFRHDSRHTGCYTWTPPTYTQDVGVEEIYEPDQSYPTGTTLTPRVEVHNYGETTAVNFTVTFEIRNQTNILIYSNTQTVASLLADSSKPVTFPSLTATPGHFHTKAYTYLTGDGDQDDNVEFGSYEVIQSQWVEDFEADGGGFDNNGIPNAWQWGVPTSGPMAAYSGTKLWATNLSGNYADSANWLLYSGIYIAKQLNPVVSFYHWYNIESQRDGGNFKISVNGGNFTLVHPVGGYPGIATWNNSGIPDQPCYNGVSGGWLFATFVLPVDSGQSFQLCWQLGSDNMTNRPGWYIDHLSGSGFGPGILVTLQTTPIQCHGDSATVVVTASGGTPPYTGTGVFVYPAGNYNFYVTDSTGIAGNAFISITEPDILTAGFFAEPTPCTGITSSLTCIPTGGTFPYFYNWSDGSINQTIYDATPGSYNVTVTDAHNCVATANIVLQASLPSSVTITASANPVASATPVTFTATAVNAGTDPFFQWKVNGINAGTGNPVYVYMPNDGDIVSCTLTNLEGCMINSNAITMSVGGVPVNLNLQNINVLNNDEFCYNATQTITVAGSGTTFKVFAGGYATMIAGHNILYKPGVKVYSGGKMKGQITTESEYCGNKNALITETTSGSQPTDPLSGQQTFFRLYPNPTNGHFILDQIPNGKVTAVEVCNLLGEKVLSVKINGEISHDFDFSGMPEGLYFVRITTDGMQKTIKLIKTR